MTVPEPEPERGTRAVPPRIPQPTAIAVRFGLLGGLLGSAFFVGPPLLGAAAEGHLADYLGTTIALLAAFRGARAIARAHPRLTYARRIVFGTTLVLLSSAIVGLALYALYAVLRPDLLAERHAGLMARVRASGRPPDRVAHELERLAAQQAQYLDPAVQALGTAGTLLFFGMLLALYSAWRWQVAERLARGPGARPEPPRG